MIACCRRDSLPILDEQLKSARLRIIDFLGRIQVRYLDQEALLPGWRRALVNLNTPEDLDRLQQPLPAVIVVARSGPGKTALLEKLVAELARRSWTIGTLKHDAHRFEIDREGKDTWRMTQASTNRSRRSKN